MSYIDHKNIEVTDFAYPSSVYRARYEQPGSVSDAGSSSDPTYRLTFGEKGGESKMLSQAALCTLSVLQTVSRLLVPQELDQAPNRGSMTNFNGFQTRRNVVEWKNLLTDFSNINNGELTVFSSTSPIIPSAQYSLRAYEVDEELSTNILNHLEGIFKKPNKWILDPDSLAQGREEEFTYTSIWDDLGDDDKDLLNYGKQVVCEAINLTRQLLDPTMIQNLMERSAGEGGEMNSLLNEVHGITDHVGTLLGYVTHLVGFERGLLKEHDTAKEELRSWGECNRPSQKWRDGTIKYIDQLEANIEKLSVQRSNSQYGLNQ
ncbi:hypothetical protein TREMEDRAFT_59143 [Tremella mesenterica DSM 1558]|uniref:uncharacterized protein n=1 Tax=Tremella mesenterica (strain ATCC 24925 / CBS 8224 / DSM 1558 / NBRC 9311 / NRRL Y-6157 / RJB 2259-6 / UBC 559-6) TaxID=578456 RepID=UPI0003F49747|nr:uncharacterized protein TREMEDRAFT_59143 [Tremella mesenterica DSM 1558]EIW72982.1 hypothetical protein TREMEDRAFT_59143 [Tremella mesenterica DSM 1558]